MQSMSAEIRELIRAELLHQESWPREPMTGWREWLGDPRAESGGGAPAGLSGGGEGAGGEGGGSGSGGSNEGGEGEGGEGGAPDLTQLFASFRTDVLSRFDRIEEGLEDDGELEDDDQGGAPQIPRIFDPRNFTDDDFDADGNLTPEAENRALNDAIQRQVAEALAPEREAEAARRRGAAADALEQKYPIFADPEARAPVFSAAQQAAQRLAQSLGQPELRDLWREPDFLEVVYLGIVGRQAAERETPAGGGSGVTLENGGSAAAAAGSGEGQYEGAGDRIAALATKSKFRLGTS